MSLKHLRISSIACLSALVMAAPALAQPGTAAPAQPVPPLPTLAPVPTMSLVAAAIADGMTIRNGDDDARQDRDRTADRSREDSEQRERERETRAYEQAREQLDQAKYDRAVERFSEVAAMKGTRADAALYWKAWSQNKAGQRAEALTTLSTLTRDYAKSRYLTQARQLEAEVRRDSGQPATPDKEIDDDLKLMAINALLDSDAGQAIPFLQKLLEGTASPKLK